MGDNGGLAFVLTLCVGVLFCLLIPPLGQALSEGARTVFARGDYLVIAGIVVALLAFEWLFAVFLDQVLSIRCADPKAHRNERMVGYVLVVCGWVGGLTLAAMFFWAVNKPVGPYW